MNVIKLLVESDCDVSEMEIDEEQTVSEARRPWDVRSGLTPYRDDPPSTALDVLEVVTDQPKTCDTVKAQETPSKVCTCANCPVMECQEDQKCCHEVPSWQAKYGSTGEGSHLKTRRGRPRC